MESKIAFTIGAYGLPQFVELNILYLRRLFPEAPILISDDVSDKSGEIKEVADRHLCDYVVSGKRRQHFAGDMQAAVNAVAFGQATNADIAVKISQRFILLRPYCVEVVQRALASHPIALPGKPTVLPGYSTYNNFNALTDIILMDPKVITPQILTDTYRNFVKVGATAWSCFVEHTFEHLVNERFTGNLIPEFTNHGEGAPLYLRKCQNNTAAYLAAVADVGMNNNRTFSLLDWKHIDEQGYSPRPVNC